jgi:hypothetical protein
MPRRAADLAEKRKQSKYVATFFIPDATYFLPLAFEDSGKMAEESMERLKLLVAELVVGGANWRTKQRWTAEDKKAYGSAITWLLRDLMVAANIQKGIWLLEMEARMRNPVLVRIISPEEARQAEAAAAERAAARQAAAGGGQAAAAAGGGQAAAAAGGGQAAAAAGGGQAAANQAE